MGITRNVIVNDRVIFPNGGLIQIHLKKALILGAGYTGTALRKYILERSTDAEVYFTHRTRFSDDLFEVPFNLDARETWQDLPEVEATFWTFPAEPLEPVADFLDGMKSRLGKIIVIGTTGSFLTAKPDEVVDEETLLDPRSPRVRGENLIRKQKGIALYASGIYGPRRNPVSWVEQGRIGASKKYLNLIHVEDLCQFLVQAYEQGNPGALYIASDNHPKRWDELIDFWNRSHGIESSINAPESKRLSKRVQSSRSIEELAINLKYPCVLDFTEQA